MAMLPPELIEFTAKFLDISDLLNMRKVCKAFKNPVDNAILRCNTNMILDSLSFTKLPTMPSDEVELEMHLSNSPFASSTKAVLLVSLTRFYGCAFEINGKSIPVKRCTSKFLTDLKMAISEISANKIELNGCMASLLPMVSKVLDGSSINKQFFNFNDKISAETIGIIRNFTCLIDSESVQITIAHLPVPDNLLRSMADTKKQIVVRNSGSENHHSDEENGPVGLVMDMLTARCNYLDLVDVLMLTEMQALDIAKSISVLGLRVYFAAAVAAKKDTKFAIHGGPIQFEIRPTSNDEMKVVEIIDTDMRVPRRVY